MVEEKKKPQEKVEVPEKFKDIVKKIEEMSVLELSELVKILEKKFGVSSTPVISALTIAPGAVPSGGAAGEIREEKTEFNVLLKEVGESKINVIKAVREITGKGLKEAKDLVDVVPKVVKEGVKKEEAEEIKKKLEGIGATVELQ